jgi:hypothetical protein
MKDIINYIQNNNFAKVLLILLGVYILSKYMSNNEKMDNIYDDSRNWGNVETVDNVPSNAPAQVQPDAPTPEKSIARPNDNQPQASDLADYVTSNKQDISADELLPKYDEADDFAKQNPVSKLLKEQNFLISGFHTGINTVMQSQKIPYYDLRSAPPIPKEVVGPWSQSSYEVPMGDGRKQLEVGF